MLSKLKQFLGISKEETKVVEAPKAKKPRAKKVKTEKILSAKEQATAAGEPYIDIVKVEIDANNINAGQFEMDWNDKFILNLIRAGYKIKDTDKDSDIVDRWFQQVCRNVALEVYEQEQADPDNRMRNESLLRQNTITDIGNGKKEIS
jgi:hypothetical protein